MSPQTATRLSWSAFAISVALGVTAIVTNSLNPSSAPRFGIVIATLDIALFSVVGAVVASRQPANPIGWIFVAVGLGIMFAVAGTNYAQLPNVPGANVVDWLSGPIWQPAIVAAIIFLPLLFPTGRLPSPRWRLIVWCAFAFLLTSFPANAFMPGPLSPQGSIQNPFGIGSAKGLLTDLSILSLIPAVVALVGAVTSLAVRYRRAGQQERQQLKWFIFACVILTVGLVSRDVAARTVPTAVVLTDIVAAVGLTALPLSIGLAILKYRLYDIDVVINKSLVYATLAIFITAVYVGIVVGIGGLLGSGAKPNLALSILATAIIAVAFQPVRERVQSVANRLVYGQRATPYEVMAEFSDRMAGALSIDEILPNMAETAAKGVGARAAQVTLFLPQGERRSEGWPNDQARAEFDQILPITYRAEQLGELAVRKDVGEPLTPAEESLLVDLASQAGLVLHNVRLAAELQVRLAELSSQAAELRASRQRLVSAQDAERDRLERTIHDGAEQRLADIASALGMVPKALAQRPEEAVETLERLTQQASATLEELRDLARGVYPPLLREHGLRAALEAQTTKIGKPITIESDGLGRYSSEVEAAVYFCCLEAINRAIGPARIRIAAGDARLDFSIYGAQLHRNVVQQLEDRVQALGGQLTAEDETLAGSIPIDQFFLAASQAAVSRSGSNFALEM